MHHAPQIDIQFDQDFAANNLFARRLVAIQAEVLSLRERLAHLEAKDSCATRPKSYRTQAH